MQIHYQFIAAAAIALIAGVGSVSADEITVDRSAVKTGTLYALPAGVAVPMSEAELDAVRGQGSAIETLRLVTSGTTATASGTLQPYHWAVVDNDGEFDI